jgi:hypothetical protein
LYDLKASLFLSKFLKGRCSIGRGRGVSGFEPLLDFRIFQPLARPALYEHITTFYSFFNNMRCKETRKREKHTAPSTEKKIIKRINFKKWFSNLSRKDSKRNNLYKSDFAIFA